MDKRKDRPKVYGEALTLDEVHERLVSEEERKKMVKKSTQQRKKVDFIEEVKGSVSYSTHQLQ